MSYLLGELAEKINAELHGDPDCKIHGVATVASAEEGQISFIANSLYKKHLSSTRASAVILSTKDFTDSRLKNALIMQDPHLGFCKVVELFHPPKKKPGKISSKAIVSGSAIISKSANIAAAVIIGENTIVGDDVIINPGTVVGDNVSISADCLIHSNVTICNDVQIGSGVILHPGVVIGADGFGLVKDKDAWRKIPQIGSVIIENNVEIGANTTIDRGAIDNTIIKTGVKIDNQVQIAHNCYIGEYTAIAACTGISGSTHIGKRCMLGGGSGFGGHLTICDDAVFTGFAFVSKSVNKPGVYSSGIPLKDNLTWRKNVARFNRLEKMAERITQLEKK